jgi:hypothetical protein
VRRSKAKQGKGIVRHGAAKAARCGAEQRQCVARHFESKQRHSEARRSKGYAGYCEAKAMYCLSVLRKGDVSPSGALAMRNLTRQSNAKAMCSPARQRLRKGPAKAMQSRATQRAAEQRQRREWRGGAKVAQCGTTQWHSIGTHRNGLALQRPAQQIK